MSTEKGLQQATGRWDEFALASAAPLGPFVRAHLAPRIPPEVLNSALVNYLPLADDEVLLAIIDSGGRQPTRSCTHNPPRVLDRKNQSARATQASRCAIALPITHT